MRARIFAVVAMLSAIGIAGSAVARAPPPANDPFERLNRHGFAIQAFLDRYLVGPAAFIYRKLTPGPIGKAFHHIMVNLSEPRVVINDMLQLRPARAGAAAVRLVVNTTLGVGGMIDVAGMTGLPHHLSSFGDTLGRYGVKPGPYLFMPMVGPSTVRDLFGNVVDATFDPLHFARYPYRSEVGIAVAVVGGLDTWTQSAGDLSTLLSNAADPYATLRSTYLQNRQGEIAGEAQLPATLPDLDEGPPTPPPPDVGGARSAPKLASPVQGISAPSDDQPAAFQSLPERQNRQPDSELPRALDQGQR